MIDRANLEANQMPFFIQLISADLFEVGSRKRVSELGDRFWQNEETNPIEAQRLIELKGQFNFCLNFCIEEKIIAYGFEEVAPSGIMDWYGPQAEAYAKKPKDLAPFIRLTPFGSVVLFNTTWARFIDQRVLEEENKHKVEQARIKTELMQETFIQSQMNAATQQIETNRQQTILNRSLWIVTLISVVISMLGIFFQNKTSMWQLDEMKNANRMQQKQYKLDSSASEPVINPTINVSIDSVVVKQLAPNKTKKK